VATAVFPRGDVLPLVRDVPAANLRGYLRGKLRRVEDGREADTALRLPQVAPQLLDAEADFQIDVTDEEMAAIRTVGDAVDLVAAKRGVPTTGGGVK
jgi:hypothetical protein